MKRTTCLNCGKDFLDVDLFCAHCGQKTKPPKLTVWEIVTDFFSNILNLEARIYKTMFHIFIPAKLTRAYVAGERKKYYNPIRILFITMIVHFALLASVVNREIPDLNKINTDQDRKLVKTHLFENIDSIAPKYMAKEDLHLIDSIKHAVHLDSLTVQDSFLLYNGKILNLDFSKEKILLDDVFNLSEEEIISKYEIKGLQRQLFLKQIIKIYKNLSDVPAFLIGNTLWTIVIVLLFIAFVMKLLYIRSNTLYVEHLVFLMHVHGMAFLIGSILFLTIYLGNLDLFESNIGATGNTSTTISIFSFAGFSFASLYFLIAQKLYYQQGWPKTLFKLIIISLSYIFILIFVALMVSLLSLFFF